MSESTYRRSLQLAGGDHLVCLQDPVSLGLLLAAAALIAYSLRKL
jgi:TctA family transporter